MITQIEIDGFKSFKDFKVELAPFQVIVGPNGSGKSNLFDALQLLSRLAEMDLISAFQDMRGGPTELFTKFPDGKTTNNIRFAVEMLVNRKVQDELGREFELDYTRLRYELTIVRRGLERLHVEDESLRAIPQSSDEWCKKYLNASSEKWVPLSTDEEKTFMDANNDALPLPPEIVHHRSNAKFINVYPDGKVVKDGVAQFNAELFKRTVLSSAMGFNYPHLLAAHQELRALKFLHLNPDSLRKSSSAIDLEFLAPDGSNLPMTLARIKKEDTFAFHNISLDITDLVPEILDIDVKLDLAQNNYDIYARTSDQRVFSVRVLSDGTLRLLALAALRNDPEFYGVLCLEEPEDGVQPLYLKKIASLLHEMATDFKDTQQEGVLLRQVLIATHSPLFISQPDIRDSLLLTLAATHFQGQNAQPLKVTRMVPVLTSGSLSAIDASHDKALEAYTIDMVKKYLDNEAVEAARNQLEQARENLHKR